MPSHFMWDTMRDALCHQRNASEAAAAAHSVNSSLSQSFECTRTGMPNWRHTRYFLEFHTLESQRAFHDLVLPNYELLKQTYDDAGCELLLATVVREPEETYKSSFEYFQVNGMSAATPALKIHGLRQNKTLQEIAFYRFLNRGNREQQLSWLANASTKGGPLRGVPCEQRQEQALRLLRQMDVVGTTEKLVDFWRTLARRIGIPVQSRVDTFKKNVHRHPSLLRRVDALAPHLRQALNATCHCSQPLYDAAIRASTNVSF